MNRATCDNPNFWRERLRQDFHVVNQTDNPKNAYYQIYDYMQTFAEYIYDSYSQYIRENLDKSKFKANVINTITTKVVQRFYDGNIKDVIGALMSSMFIYTESLSDVIIDQMNIAGYETFDRLLHNTDRSAYVKVDIIQWSNTLQNKLTNRGFDTYLDVNRNIIVNINEIPPLTGNLRLPQLRMVGTRENIINHFFPLGFSLNQIESQLLLGIPLL